MSESQESFPEAKLAPSPWSFLSSPQIMWVVAAVSIAGAIFLAVQAWRTPGPKISVEFEQGYGIAPGDPVRLRGIDVGEVEEVSMSADLAKVEVEIRLSSGAASLAREGTRFWIQRPQVSLSSISGLDTLVGPKYIGVRPGDSDGRKQMEFTGIESPRQFSDANSIGISVRFRQGYGVAVGAPVRFRGVQVGEVVDVELDHDLGHVLVHAELKKSATRLARAGAKYWIERPQVGVAQVSGLDTLLGGRYLAVLPGADDEAGNAADDGAADKGAALQLEFEGLDAPATQQSSSGGIEVVLQSPARYGLKAGSPVLYRGVTIGKVVRVGLASDGTSVESRVYIQSTYRSLVRDNSQFWSKSGVGVQFGLLRGVQLDAESLETIAAGGVAMATPSNPGKRVSTGHRFVMAEEEDSDWAKWRPSIPVGRSLLPENAQVPVPMRATLRWKRRRLGFLREEQMECWTHPLGPDRLLCPWQGEVPSALTLEFEGRSIELPIGSVNKHGALIEISKLSGLPAKHIWAEAQRRRPPQPEDCVLMAGPDTLPVSAGRLRVDPETDRWKVDISIELSKDWHGASVVSQEDGALLGMLLWNDGHPEIVVP